MKKFLFIISIIITTNIAAQQPATGIWASPQAMINFNNKWQWYNEGGYRTIGNSTPAYQYLYRTGVKYFFNAHWSSTMGLAFFFTRTNYEKSNHEFGKEFRLWQEINYKVKLTQKFNLQNRMRTEERFFESTKSKSSYKAFRLRNRLAGTLMFSEKWGVQLSDEYMQQYDHKIFSFNQNRLIASAVYQANKTTQWQGGYMWLLRRDYSQHIITFTVQKTFSLHAHEKHS